MRTHHHELGSCVAMPKGHVAPISGSLQRWRRNVETGAASICRGSDAQLEAVLGPSAGGRMDLAETTAGELERVIELFGETEVLRGALTRVRGLIEAQPRIHAA